MTQSVRKYFLFFITVLAGFFMLFCPITVFSQSPNNDKIPTTDTLTVNFSGDTLTDITDSYLSRVFDRGKWDNEDAYLRGSSLVKNALKSGSLGVFQFSARDSENKLFTYVLLVVSESSGPSVISKTLASDVVVYNFSLTGSSRYSSIVVGPRLVYFSDTVGSLNFLMYSDKFSLFSYSGKYSFDPLSGLQDPLPRKTSFYIPGTSDSFSFKDDCGLDIPCHLNNFGNFIKALFFFIIGIFDFSENNSILLLLKWLFIPDDIESLFDFSNLSDHFKSSLGSIFSAFDLFKRFYESLFPSIIIDDSGYYCHSSLSPTHYDSQAHIYILNTTIFGKPFRPDICSFERLIGGPYSMRRIRVFTSIFLFSISLFVWYRFFNKLIGSRF